MDIRIAGVAIVAIALLAAGCDEKTSTPTPTSKAPTSAAPAAKDSDELQIRELLTQVRAVLTESLRAGGTSFDALYVNVNGEGGYFERALNVYGREGEPCPRCGTAIRRLAFMNRSSFLCPNCQRRPRS